MAYSKYNRSFIIEAYALDQNTGKTLDLTNRLSRLAIQRSFFKNIFEQVVISLDNITKEEMEMLRDNDFSIGIRIYEFSPSIISPDASESTEIIPESKVCEFIVRVYDKPFLAAPDKIETDGDSEIGEREKASPTYMFELVGVPEEQIKHNSKVINNVFRSALLVDAVVNITCKELTNERLVMVEPTNSRVYMNIIVPPNNFIPALENIDRIYHLYNSVANFYFDRDAFYIYPALMKDINSNIIECLVKNPETTNSTDSINIELDKSNNNFRVTMYNLPSFQTVEKVMSHVPGTNTSYYSYDENFNLQISNFGNDKSFEKERYYWNDDGSYYSETNFAEAYDQGKSIGLTLNGINPFLINPLTTLRINSTKFPAANGDYTVGEASVVFGSSSRRYYSSNVLVTAIKR